MVILNKLVVVVDFFRLGIILHFRDWAFCTLTTFYYRDGTFSTLIPFYYRNVTFCTLISFYCRNRTFSTLISFYNRYVTFSTLISFYYRDVTFSTLILFYYPYVTFSTKRESFSLVSTLIPSYYRDETFITSISFYYRNVTFSTLISFYYRDGTFVPWSHFTEPLPWICHCWYHFTAVMWHFCTLISLRVHRDGTLSTLIMISLPWCTRPFGCLAEHFYTVLFDRDQNLSLLSGGA